MSSTAADAAIVLALLQRRQPGTTPASVVEHILAAGSVTAAWELRERETLTADADDEHLLASTADELQKWSAMGIATHAFTDSAYPQELLSVCDLPAVVWTRGTLEPLDAAVSVVGTRAPTAWGHEFARAVAQGMAEAGITVASGLAAGIDTEAHLGALEAGQSRDPRGGPSRSATSRCLVTHARAWSWRPRSTVGPGSRVGSVSPMDVR